MNGTAQVLLLGGLAGGLAAAAAREAVVATPAVARRVRATLMPLGRARNEGYAPDADERRRLAMLATVALLGGGLVVLGPRAAPFLALAGPAAMGAVLRRRRRRYLRDVDGGLVGACGVMADALSAGRSLRAAIGEAARAVPGAAGSELARVAADLELGAATALALDRLRARVRSGRADAFCVVLLSQRLAGGDLAGLLRRFAAAAAERDRTIADARSATAQARFTGMLVAAMPAGAAIFAELLQPGFVGGMLGQPASAVVLAMAAGLQGAGFAAIARLSRVDGGR